MLSQIAAKIAQPDVGISGNEVRATANGRLPFGRDMHDMWKQQAAINLN